MFQKEKGRINKPYESFEGYERQKVDYIFPKGSPTLWKRSACLPIKSRFRWMFSYDATSGNVVRERLCNLLRINPRFPSFGDVCV